MSKRQVQRVLAQFPGFIDGPRYTEQTVSLLGHDFRVPDAASFIGSYDEIFFGEVYRFDASTQSPRIIDCGGNYGLSSLYFMRHYPDARLTVVEADPAIFSVLQWNLASAGQAGVELLNRAVAERGGTVAFHMEGADGGRIHPLGTASEVRTVEAITLDELIDGPTDLLKIDIEGAETAALLACSKLADVNHLFVEYHSFADQEQSLADLLLLLRQHGFRCYIHTQKVSQSPFTKPLAHMGMDMQLNIFAKRAAT